MKYIKRHRLLYNVVFKLKKWNDYRKDGLNIYKTILVNFKLFPLKEALKFPIFVFGKLKIYHLGTVIIESPIFTGMIELGRNRDRFKASAGSAMIDNRGIIIFKGAVHFSIDYGIYSQPTGRIEFGKFCFLGNNVKLYAYNKIVIGMGCSITSEVQIFDSGFHFMKNVETGEIGNIMGQVVIGNWCWIGNRTTIARKTILPDYSVVTSNSLVNKDFSMEKFPLIGGIPARKISNSLVRIFNREDENHLWAYFVEHRDVDSIYEHAGLINEYELVEKEFEGQFLYY